MIDAYRYGYIRHDSDVNESARADRAEFMCQVSADGFDRIRFSMSEWFRSLRPVHVPYRKQVNKFICRPLNARYSYTFAQLLLGDRLCARRDEGVHDASGRRRVPHRAHGRRRPAATDARTRVGRHHRPQTTVHNTNT